MLDLTIPQPQLPELIDTTNVKIKHPKRILHFSDGTLEEFSDDDVVDANEDNVTKKTNFTDEELKQWTPWMLHKMYKTGTTVLNGCDYVGEKLAAFLGITTPKYIYEINQYKKFKHEQEQLAKEEMEASSWLDNNNVQNVQQQRLNQNAVGENNGTIITVTEAVTRQNQINKY